MVAIVEGDDIEKMDAVIDQIAELAGVRDTDRDLAFNGLDSSSIALIDCCSAKPHSELRSGVA